MAKTCIVCGGVAGSREHVFPAALGGRRTNSGIYCAVHDNGYSGLVQTIAEQVDFLNAYLGVRPDHSTQKKVVCAEDSLTGEPIFISANQVKFSKPWVLSRAPVGNGEVVQMAFPDRQSANQWIKDEEAKGNIVSLQNKPAARRYFPSSIHHRRSFGGPCGLGAIAYITQTFFAQEFPELARSGALSDFIAYTQAIARVAALNGCEQASNESPELTAARSNLQTALAKFGGSALVWWDFELPVAVSPNTFEFGHRVTVGIDDSDGQLYGRVSLFSALNFAIQLGAAPGACKTREIIIDIDPLAGHPPGDIRKATTSTALSRVQIPQHRTEGLASAIADGSQQQVLERLLVRLFDYQLTKIAREMSVALAPCAALPESEARTLIRKVIEEHSQLIWLAISQVIQGFKETLISGNLSPLAPVLDQMVARDVHSPSGLSSQAEATLSLAQAALIEQIAKDLAAGRLTEVRIADLMGRGPGLYIVGQAVLAPFQQALFVSAAQGASDA